MILIELISRFILIKFFFTEKMLFLGFSRLAWKLRKFMLSLFVALAKFKFRFAGKKTVKKDIGSEFSSFETVGFY
jgi:hypothetical protein